MNAEVMTYLNILVIAPHADDEILGVGGTIARYVSEGNHIYVCIASRGYEPTFSSELVEKVLMEANNSHNYLGVKKTFYLNFPASMLEKSERSELNNSLLEVIKEVKPDIVFIPHFGDMQQDHKVIAKAAMVVLRPKYEYKVPIIYSYETLSETEWNIPHAANTFIPNVFVDISEYIETKLKAMKEYQSQLNNAPNPRSLEVLEALAKYRGSAIHVKAAEAFALIRQII